MDAEQLRIRSLFKSYPIAGERILILKDINLTIYKGELVSIQGPSGSGKSTLMNILGCLDVPDSGEYNLLNKDVAKLNDNELAEIRNQAIGFVFQNFNLLPKLTAVENVELPLQYGGNWKNKKKAEEILDLVGLSDRMHHGPNQLSGGQRQRVAIARALVNDPAIILADEPTGNLDTQTGEEILQIFEDLHKQGRTIIIITHDTEVGDKCKTRYLIRDGVLTKDDSI